MKILQISTSLPFQENAGGAEKFCFDLSKRLSERGHEVEIAVPSSLDNFQGIKLHKLYKVNNIYLRKLFFDYYNPLNLLKIKKIIRIFKPEIIHFHSLYGLSSQLIGYISKRIPTVVTAHDYWPFCYWSTLIYNNKPCEMCYAHDTIISPQSYLHKLHKIIVFNHFKHSYFVAPSKYMRNKLERVGHYKNISIIPNGIAENQQITTYKKNIIWVGRLVEEKGLQTVIDILDNIVYRNNCWKIYVLGEGKFRKQLEGKYKNVIFCGFRNPEYYYVSSSILLFTSIWPENLPYSIIEGMSHGLVVIASNVGGVKEIIRHNKTGILYPPRNRTIFANQINRLINNQIMINQLGRAAYNNINEKYSWNKVTDRYIKLYNDLLEYC